MEWARSALRVLRAICAPVAVALAATACGGVTKTVTVTTGPPTTATAATTSVTTTSSEARVAPKGHLTTRQVKAATAAADGLASTCIDIQSGSSKARTSRDSARYAKNLPVLLNALQLDPKTVYASPNPITGTKYVSMVGLAKSAVELCTQAGQASLASVVQGAMP